MKTNSDVVDLNGGERLETAQPIVRIPAHASMNGARYPVTSWNSEGFSLRDAHVPATEGPTPVSFEVQLPDRRLTVKGRATPAGRKDGLSTFTFSTMEPVDRARLQSVISDYLTGAIPIAAAKANDPVRNRISILRMLGLGAVWLAIAGILTILVMSVDQRFLVVRAPGAVAPAMSYDVSAPADGVIDAAASAGVAVGENIPVAVIKSPRLYPTSIASPCACTVIATYADVGDAVHTGQRIATLFPQDGEVQLAVELPLNEAKRLRPGARVDAEDLTSSAQLHGKVVSVDFPVVYDVSTLRQARAIVRVQPDQPFAKEDIGRVFSVQIRAAPALAHKF